MGRASESWSDRDWDNLDVLQFKRVLHLGMHGKDVKAVKIGLKRASDSHGIVLTHHFGPAMRTNLKRFQTAAKLRADGIYGPKTHEILEPHFSAYARWLYRRQRIETVRSPFPGGWIPNRLDMGFDGTFSGHIVAPFDGIVTYTTDFNASWRGGIVQIKADKKPRGMWTDTLYFAEGLRPLVGSGVRVKMGEPIAEEAPSGWGNPYGTTADGRGQIEWGLAAHGVVGAYVNTYAIELGLGSWSAKVMVLAFAAWAKSLGLRGPTSIFSAGNA